MMLNSVKSNKPIVRNSAFLPIYRVRTNQINKIIIITSVLLICLLMIVALNNNSLKKAKTLSKSKENTITSTKITIPDTDVETCTSTLPIYGGSNAKSCVTPKYTKKYECLMTDEEVNALITKFSLTDQTFSSSNLVSREGEVIMNGINSYRIFAVFKNSKCLIDLTTDTKNKDLLYEIFEQVILDEEIPQNI
jgi:hypothetical protein